jgi:2-polyprenyl-3-methyl-5-hydroxy-6-metoxy-1,4-benzoquinol methylase
VARCLEAEAERLIGRFQDNEARAALSDHVQRYCRVHRGRFLHMLGLAESRRPRRLLSIGLSFGLPEIVAARALGAEVIGTDYRAEKRDHWAAAARESGVRVLSLDLLKAPASQLIAHGPFQMIWCCEVLEHLRLPPQRVVPELCSLLAPGGELLITVPNVGRWGNVVRLLRGENIVEPLADVSRDQLREGATVFDRWIHVREPSLAEMAAMVDHDAPSTVDWRIWLPRPPLRLRGNNARGLLGQMATLAIRGLRPTIYCLGRLQPNVRRPADEDRRCVADETAAPGLKQPSEEAIAAS